MSKVFDILGGTLVVADGNLEFAINGKTFVGTYDRSDHLRNLSLSGHGPKTGYSVPISISGEDSDELKFSFKIFSQRRRERMVTITLFETSSMINAADDPSDYVRNVDSGIKQEPSDVLPMMPIMRESSWDSEPVWTVGNMNEQTDAIGITASSAKIVKRSASQTATPRSQPDMHSWFNAGPAKYRLQAQSHKVSELMSKVSQLQSLAVEQQKIITYLTQNNTMMQSALLQMYAYSS